jgi:predicted  nucleic acid-binding Zn-ribbon protein
LLDEKDKVMLNLNKKLKIPAIKHPQTAELAALEHEREAFKKQSLDFEAKFQQLENEKLEWSKENIEMATRVISLSYVVPSVTSSTAERKSGTQDIIQAMSKIILKDGEIK